MSIDLLKILPLIFLVAMLYSSVGHGGASGYLAVMSLLGVSTVFMRSSSLTLNLFVSGISFYQFYRNGFFRWNLFYPFAISSIPMAYLGATILLNSTWYNMILGVFLIIAALRLTGLFDRKASDNIKEPKITTGIIIGAILGFFSGMIGIGGGIILSPLILIFGWGNVKETAAVSALFIFVNSISGLLGLGFGNLNLGSQFTWWVLAAVAGGLVGSFWGSRFAKNLVLKNVLAFVIFFAAIKLIFVR
jgi:uncharacterized protein